MGIGGFLQTLIALTQIRNDRVRLRRHWRYVCGGAVAVALYPLAFYSSMRISGVTAGTLLTISSAPLFSALIERVADKKRLTIRWRIGAMLGVIGTAMLCAGKSTAQWHAASTAIHTADIAGMLLALAAGATYAAYSWTSHRLMRCGIASNAAMGATFGIGGLLLMPVLAITGAELLASMTNAAVGLYMIFVPMFIGYVLFGKGLASLDASTATTLSLFEPIVAAVLAVAVVGERLSMLGWSGALLVIACLFVLSTGKQASQTA